MTLRLVLVSLVAALGLTIPGTPMIESWVASSQYWINARFADWDTRNPPAADYVIVSDYYDSARFAGRPAIAGVTGAEAAPETVAARTVSPAATLTTASLGSKDPQPGIKGAAIRRVSLSGSGADFRPIDITGGWHRGLAVELIRRHDGITLAVAHMPSFVPARPRFAPLAISEPRCTLVDELNRIHEGIGLAAPKPSLAPRVGGGPSYEPIPVPDQLQVGIAYELNRRSEGIEPSPRSIAVGSMAGTSPTMCDPHPDVVGFDGLERQPNLYFAGEFARSFEPSAIRSSVASPLAATLVRSGEDPVAPAAVTIRKASTIRVVAGTVSERTDSPDDLDFEVTGELIPTDDGFGSPGPRYRSATPTMKVSDTRRQFDPLIVDEKSPLSLVDELNRMNEGLSPMQLVPAIPTPRVASTSRPSRNLSRAVELTRDAVYAWVNVLTGPALVAVTGSR